MDLLNGKCNFTNPRNELLHKSNRCNPTPFRHAEEVLCRQFPEEIEFK